MTTKLGGSLLVFGGIYGNLPAFEKLLKIADALAIPPANFICTGDFVAYCAQGEAVCQRAKSALKKSVVVRGNCERALMEDDADCGCGFADDSRCKLLAVDWFRHAQQTISADSKKWFAALPFSAQIIFGKKRLAVFHAAAAADNEFIFHSSDAAKKLNDIRGQNADGVIAGHCGIPFTQKLPGNYLWHNSGALGMPANDGTKNVWFSVWQENDDGIRIRHRALSYQTAKTQQAMSNANMPCDYRNTLDNGIWPSDSILPAAEKQRQGIPMQPPDIIWQN